MDLASLKAAMDKAVADAAAKPEDADLKAAAEAAKAAYDAAVEDAGGQDDFDETKADEATKKYLAKLRKENATHRTKAKDLASKLTSEKEKQKAILKAAGIESDDDKPEVKVKALSEENQTLAFRQAVLESAIQHGISADRLKYFQFLVTEATNELQENEELSEEKLAEIVAEAKKGGSKGAANSTVGAGATGGQKPADGAGDTVVTLEKFCAMGIMARSALYGKNPDLYQALMTEARAKKKLV